jgi:hypothetical protein
MKIDIIGVWELSKIVDDTNCVSSFPDHQYVDLLHGLAIIRTIGGLVRDMHGAYTLQTWAALKHLPLPL